MSHGGTAISLKRKKDYFFGVNLWAFRLYGIVYNRLEKLLENFVCQICLFANFFSIVLSVLQIFNLDYKLRMFP